MAIYSSARFVAANRSVPWRADQQVFQGKKDIFWRSRIFCNIVDIFREDYDVSLVKVFLRKLIVDGEG